MAAATRFVMMPSGPFRGEMEAPPSKSSSHRALVLAALAHGTSRLTRCLQAEDIALTRRGLSQLGISISQEGPEAFLVQGCGGRLPGIPADLHLGNAGTGLRFLLALVCTTKQNSFSQFSFFTGHLVARRR